MAGNKSLTIILDTNIWISFLISNRYKNLDLLFSQSRIKILFSTELLSEIQDTIEKPKLKKFGKTKIQTNTTFLAELKSV